MNPFFSALWPELLLSTVACVLFLLGVSRQPNARRLAALLALLSLLAVFLFTLAGDSASSASWNDVQNGALSHYIKLITSGVGVLFVLLAWPTGPDASGNLAIDFGGDTGEFFALMLLSLVGLFLVGNTSDIMLLFLGIEMASIPTYIMVSISRPLPVAQEAGVKYFFLGAMSAAIMLFGFSYLYGVTGQTSFDGISAALHGPGMLAGSLTAWQTLAIVMLIGGFAFKMAAVPLHAYAGDVYQGAATPVTAFLAFVPKTAGIIALIKMLMVIGGPLWMMPHEIFKLLWVLAVLTMSVGNVLGLLQFNIKRVFAYSSIAHTGYMMVGLTTLLAARWSPDPASTQGPALAGVLFYLAAYGVMNTGAFGVLMMLPARRVLATSANPAAEVAPTAGAAETFEDIAGQGHKHVGLALCMAVSCFSLTGLPLTVGFLGKLVLIRPALQLARLGDPSIRSMMFWLVVITMINAAVSAAYYLRIVATLFLRPEPVAEAAPSPAVAREAFAFPLRLAVGLSVIATLGLGIIVPATNALSRRVSAAATMQVTPPDAPVVARANVAP